MLLEFVIFGLLYAVWLGVVIKHNRIAILLMPLFFPLYLVRFEVGGIPVYFVEGLILLTAIPVFIKMFLGHHEVLEKGIPGKLAFMFKSLFGPKEKHFVNFVKSPFLPISLFLIATLISALIVPNETFKNALGILKSWVIIPLIYFVIFYQVVKRKRDIQLAMYSYIGSAFFLGLWALYQSVSGHYITIDSRASGPFESANYLAMYIAPALIFGTVRFIQTFIHNPFETASIRWNSFERRIYIGGVVAILFAVLVLTQSYGGIIGVCGTLFLYLLYERIQVKTKESRKFLNKLIGFVVLLVVLGGGIAITLNVEKFQNLIKTDEQTSISTRLEIWEVGFNLIKENPILGIGLGQYQTEYVFRAEEILGHAPYEAVRLHSHNLYMEFLLNSGLLGLISFLWIVVLAFMQLKKIDDREGEQLMLTSLVMLTYILVHGLIDVPFWKNDLALVFWLIIGNVFALSKIKNANK